MNTKLIYILIVILLFMTIIVGMVLYLAHNLKRDTRAISNIQSIRAELFKYYYLNNSFPSELDELTRGQKFFNSSNLINPDTGRSYDYISCAQTGPECVPAISDPQNYMLKYSLKLSIGNLGRGQHIATAEGLSSK